MNENTMAVDNYDEFITTNINDPLTTLLSNLTINSNTISNYGTISGSGLLGYYTAPTVGNFGPNITLSNSNKSGTIEMNGNDADLVINGKSLKQFMEKVEERLLILQPDPAKLEKYAALRKAYEHYKLLEKLVQED